MSNDRLLTSITKLNGENYHDWKFAVSIVLRQKGCWKVTSGEEEKPSGETEKSWEIKAEEGFTLIALTVEASQYTYIRDAKNGPEAWKALKDIYEKNSRSMRINLKRQFYGFEHDTSASISAYVNGITDLARKLNAIGVSLSDQEITDVLIFNLDNEYSSIASSLVASKEELTTADVKSALFEEERRKGGPGTETALYSNGINNDGKGPGGRRGPNRDRREGLIDNRTCYRCGRTGHISRNCKAVKTADGEDISDPPTNEISQYASLGDMYY
jgi:hypothetical protein